jgi:hypothetical protein
MTGSVLVRPLLVQRRHVDLQRVISAGCPSAR